MIKRTFTSTIKRASNVTAFNVFEKSCYNKVDFKINENASVNEAVSRFTALNIGCLAVTNSQDKVVGVCSGRDYITKVASLNKFNENLKVKDICTYGPKVIVAKKEDTIDDCMHKVMFKGIRHLLLVDDKNEKFVGMISLRDIIREIRKKDKDTITRLSDFSLGKGAFFGSE